ncbi:MAG TPA: hypothetical protein VH351_22870 [Bryobacteraceae bacterium]|jgi:hypothetical protein|nr:hypothetical protein [Bryobacteraceae bacterium]
MKKVMLACALSVSVFSIGAFADTMTGFISDANCGAKHTSAADAKCVAGCLKKGADPVLVSDGKVYKFDDASKDKAKALAGQAVTVEGSVSGDTVTATSVSATK